LEPSCIENLHKMRLFTLTLSLLWLVVLATCTTSQNSAGTPTDGLYFPVGMAASHDSKTVYIVNSNFDIQYDTGWLSVVDIDKLVSELDAGCSGACRQNEVCVQLEGQNVCRPGLAPAVCGDSGCIKASVCVDAQNGGSDIEPVCASMQDLRASIVESLKIPSLGAQIAVHDSDALAVITTRGGNPIVHVEMTAGRDLHCGEAESIASLSQPMQLTDCDAAHLTTVVPDSSVKGNADGVLGVAQDRHFSLESSASQAVPEQAIADPFGVTFVPNPDGPETWVAVGYLGGGMISLFDLSQPGQISHRRLLGEFATGIGRLRAFQGLDNSLYLTALSQVQPGGLQQSSLISIDLAASLLDEDKDHFITHTFDDGFSGDEFVDLVFSGVAGESSPWAFAAMTRPNMIVSLDMSLESKLSIDEKGQSSQSIFPRHTPVYIESLEGKPGSMAYIARDGGDLLAVTSFENNSLLIFDVWHGQLSLNRVFEQLGQGPFELIHLTHAQRDFILVGMFFDHAISIIEVTSNDSQEFSYLGRLRSQDLPSAVSP
jgi:hypothetical protein